MRNDSSDWKPAWITLLGTPPPADLRDVDFSAVKAAFRRRARETHPDVSPSQGDATAFRKAARAFEQLKQAVEQPVPCRRRRAPVPDGPVRVVRASTSVPPRKLALAQFLFHLGWVPWDAVLQSLRWQQERRSKLGALAVQLGLLGSLDVREVLARQRPGERFGACAARLGLMSPNGVERLLQRQGRLQPLVGQFFVQQGLLSPEQLREALARQRAHNDQVEREHHRAA